LSNPTRIDGSRKNAQMMGILVHYDFKFLKRHHLGFRIIGLPPVTVTKQIIVCKICQNQDGAPLKINYKTQYVNVNVNVNVNRTLEPTVAIRYNSRWQLIIQIITLSQLQ
jgi:hypothetical protein